MPLRHVIGDLLESDCQVLVNAVNCVGVTGAGLAKQFAERFPAQVAEYREFCRAGRMRPGVLHSAALPGGRLIVSVPTKRHWREPSRFPDVAKGVAALAGYCEEFEVPSVAVPPLGCGLGGLPQHQVLNAIRLKMADLATEVWLYNFNER